MASLRGAGGAATPREMRGRGRTAKHEPCLLRSRLPVRPLPLITRPLRGRAPAPASRLVLLGFSGLCGKLSRDFQFAKFVVRYAPSLRDGLPYLVAWSARERRAFIIEELPMLMLLQQATAVDVRSIVEQRLRPMP